MATRESDPIIAELRAVRAEHAARFGFDVAAIFEDIRRWQVESGREFVRLPPRPVAVPMDNPSGTGRRPMR